MKEITVNDLEDNLDIILSEIKEGEHFAIVNEDGQIQGVLVPYEEYESIIE